MYLFPHPKSLLRSLRRDRDGSIILSSEDFEKLISVALLPLHVDADWYLKTYPDVAQAISAGEVSGPEEHYRQSGFLEGRFPIPPKVDDEWYRRQYPDVAIAIRDGVVESSESHYLGGGYAEGRLPRLIPVDENWYLTQYPSVAEKIDQGEFESAQDHFVKAGYLEGKLPFKPAKTLASA